MDVVSVTSTEFWQTGTASISTATGSIPEAAWRAPLSRHLKLAAFVAGEDPSFAIRKSSRGYTRTAQKDKADDAREKRLGPLHVAASQGILRLGSALLAAKPGDASVPDSWGRSPLHWAAMTDRRDFMQMLLDKGAEVDARDHQDRTPLFSACAFGVPTAARLLLLLGADKDSCCRRGLTPLHGAAAGGHFEIVKILIQAGADTRRRTAVGASPRHVAERQGHMDIVKLLLVEAGGGDNHHITMNASSGIMRESTLSANNNEGGGGFRGGDASIVVADYKFERSSLLHRHRPRSPARL